MLVGSWKLLSTAEYEAQNIAFCRCQVCDLGVKNGPSKTLGVAKTLSKSCSFEWLCASCGLDFLRKLSLDLEFLQGHVP